MYEWYVYEELGDGQIAGKLNEFKVPKTNHKRLKRASPQWTHVMVRNILTNPLYRGEFVANRTDELNNLLPEHQWTIVAIPASVSEFTFLQAQEARKRRVSNMAGTDYLLSGKLVDMDLERPKRFVGAKRFKGGFSYRRKQFDKGGKHYPVFEIAGQQMEDFVWEKIMAALTNPQLFIEQYLRREADPTRIEKLQEQLMLLREKKANNEISVMRIEEAYETGAYSQEKMEEKVAEKNKQNVEIESQMQDIEDQLSLISAKEIEIAKLKEASEQVKHRLKDYDRRQKKIICQIFVDRVEMRRRKVHNRWKVSGDVFFRFNPNKFEKEIELGRTVKKLVSAVKGQLEKKNVVDGRVWAAQLERLREYHRESGNLGKRYVEVIRAFNPDYMPYTEEDLAQMSRSIPCLAIT